VGGKKAGFSDLHWLLTQQSKDQSMCNSEHCLSTDDTWNIFCQMGWTEGI